jgi:hypothetical protein
VAQIEFEKSLLHKLWQQRFEGVNPARRTEQFKERRSERFLTGGELERHGFAIREAETNARPGTWTNESRKPHSVRCDC